MTKIAPRGQVLVIGAVAMAVLIAIAALVIDLGFSWMLRRQEQNAVDPAAVAAARYLPGGNQNEMNEAACFYVQQHGFFEDDDASCSTARGLGDLYVGPPRAGDYAGLAGYVEVYINADHPVFFGRIFGQSTAYVASSAIAANGGTGVGNVSSNSLVALDPSSCGAGTIDGNGEVNITNVGGSGPGGFVYINSTCGVEPPVGTPSDPGSCQNDADGAMRFNGINARLVTEHLYVRGTCDSSSNPWDGPTTEGADELTDTLFGLVEPNHTDVALFPSTWGQTACPATGQLLNPGPGCVFEQGKPVVLDPGVYYGGLVIRGQTQLQLNPGIYYIAGGGIQMSGNPNNSLDVVGTGRALFFSTGDPGYTDPCAPNPDFPPDPPVQSVQYSRPDGFASSDGTWEGTFASINETTGDATADGTFLASPTDPTATNAYEVTLTDVTTPAANKGVVIRYRYGKDVDSDATIDLVVQLKEGTKVVASQEHLNIEGVTTWQEGSFELTTSQAASIVDWNELSLNINPTTTVPGVDAAPDRSLISWAEVEVPPAEAPGVARHCQGRIEIVGGNSFTAKATDIIPWAGLLMWQDGTLDGNGRGNNPSAKIEIEGKGGINISGTIYAPLAQAIIRGNGESGASDTAAVQVIAWQFSVGGNGVLNMPYDPDQLFGTPEAARKGLVQ